MARTFTAQMQAFADKSKEKMSLVIRQSAADVFDLATTTQPGVDAAGGSFQVGKVPVDTGFLINSFQIGLNGGSGAGADGVALVVAGMKLGDTVTGTFSAEYARHVEYGTSTMAGRFFVLSAAQQWQAIVSRNAAKARAL
jgi:hypothetical protein